MTLDGQPPHILVINDSPEILALKREIFEEEGFRVTTHFSGDLQVNEIIELAPDLVILDYSSESESGLLQWLTRESPLGQTPIMLCTGAIREVKAIKPYLDAIGVSVIYKPFEIDHLVNMARHQLGLPSQTEESRTQTFE
jgi:DNA-binding response OmpR family regulator